MAVTLDGACVRRGIATYVTIAVPSGIVAAVADRSSSTGSSAVLVVAALLFFLVAPLVAGAVAGGAQSSPFVHGALAVAVPGAAYLVIWSAVGVLRNNLTTTNLVSNLLYLFIETGLGMLGGYVGFRRQRRLA